MFENFSFDNLLQPKNLMAGGGMLAQMGQGMQNGGGLLGGMNAMQGGGMGGLLQNKEVLDMLKLLAQRSGAANPFPMAGGGLLGPWAGERLMFGLTQEQLMSIGGLLGGAGQGLNQGGWQGAFGGAQQGLLNAQQMMQAQEMMKLRKAAADMQTQQFEMQKADQARKMQREQAMRTGLLGGPASTGGAGGDQVAMQPGLLDQMNVSPIVRAMAQADPEAVGGGLLAQAMKGPEKPIAVPKGTALYDPTSRATIFENKDSDPQSPIAKLQDDLRAGRITPEQYAIGVSKMGPAQTTVNVGNRELDKEAVKFYGEVQRSSMDASASLPKIARARQLAANFAQGATAPTVQAIKRYAKDLGLSGVAGLKDDVGAAEAFNALMIDLRLDMSQRLKGAITEREQVLLEQMVARQGNTVEGNLMILDQLEGIARRSVGQAKALRDYRAKTGSVDAGVFDVMGETPAYEPPPMREAPQAAPKQPPPGAKTATNPQTKEKIWWDEAAGKWEKF